MSNKAIKELAFGTANKKIPFRGTPTLFSDKINDPEEKPMLTAEMHARVFNMDVQEDIDEYENVLNKAANQRARVTMQKSDFDKDTKNYKVFVVWGDLYFEEPGEAKQRILNL